MFNPSFLRTGLAHFEPIDKFNKNYPISQAGITHFGLNKAKKF